MSTKAAKAKSTKAPAAKLVRPLTAFEFFEFIQRRKFQTLADPAWDRCFDEAVRAFRNLHRDELAAIWNSPLAAVYHQEVTRGRRVGAWREGTDLPRPLEGFRIELWNADENDGFASGAGGDCVYEAHLFGGPGSMLRAVELVRDLALDLRWEPGSASYRETRRERQREDFIRRGTATRRSEGGAA